MEEDNYQMDLSRNEDVPKTPPLNQSNYNDAGITTNINKSRTKNRDGKTSRSNESPDLLLYKNVSVDNDNSNNNDSSTKFRNIIFTDGDKSTEIPSSPSLNDYKDIDISNINDYLTSKKIDLLEHQKIMIYNFKKLNYHVLLADEMGLGKTISSICAMDYHFTNHKVLIVCPLYLFPTWRNNIENLFDNNKNIYEINTSNRLRIDENKLKQCDYIIINYFSLYDLITKVDEDISSSSSSSKNESDEENLISCRDYYITNNLLYFITNNIKNIIFDEGHLLKTNVFKKDTSSTMDDDDDDAENISYNVKQNLPIIKFIKYLELINGYNNMRILILTGTPVTNTIADIFHFLYILCSKLISDITSHDEILAKSKINVMKFIESNYNDFIKTCEDDALYNIENIVKLLKQCVIRRTCTFIANTINDDCIILPKKDTKFILLNIENNNHNILNHGNNNELYNYYGKIKAKCVLLLLNHIYQKHDTSINKIVVFFYSKQIGELLLSKLKNMFHIDSYIDIFLIYGDVKVAERENIINQFKQNKKSCILLLSLMTGSQGYSLVTDYCNTIIFCELVYQPHILLQAEGRLIRLSNNNQMDKINIYYLIIDNHDYNYMKYYVAEKHDIITKFVKICNYKYINI